MSVFEDYVRAHRPSTGAISSIEIDSNWDYDYHEYETYYVKIIYNSDYDSSEIDYAVSQVKRVLYDALDYVRRTVGDVSLTSSGTRYSIERIEVTSGDDWD